MQKFNALDKENNTLVSGNAGDGKYLNQTNLKKKKIINLIEFLK